MDIITLWLVTFWASFEPSVWGFEVGTNVEYSFPGNTVQEKRAGWVLVSPSCI